MKKRNLIVLAVASVIAFTSIGFSNSNAADPKGNAYGYWNKARLESAQPIELVVDEKTGVGKIVKLARNTSGGSTTSTSSGSNWSKGGDPLNLTGKIFFTAVGGTYVCSGAFVNDSLAGQAIVQTAGHCAWDQAGNSFVQNFVFIPGYQSNPVNDCATNTSRCFAGVKIYVRNDFSSQTSFNSTALKNDWAYVVVDKDATSSFPISFGNSYTSGKVSSFGYPAATPYNGNQLINCLNPIFKDTKNANQTWGMSCTMTGGASGGPWIYPWNTTTNSGTLFSLNSYKYTTDKSKMYGPMFNQGTADTYNSANGVTTLNGVRASN